MALSVPPHSGPWPLQRQPRACLLPGAQPGSGCPANTRLTPRYSRLCGCLLARRPSVPRAFTPSTPRVYTPPRGRDLSSYHCRASDGEVPAEGGNVPGEGRGWPRKASVPVLQLDPMTPIQGLHVVLHGLSHCPPVHIQRDTLETTTEHELQSPTTDEKMPTES